ncbi:MAG: putative CoA-substrate-specific enzyme activase [Deltaproteobacteria bacterium]|jgi:benzoyl-CoA reductase subunit D|nr:putative CoA-substrate-specific enzyme activase [Deltaproteobacteria bacterium]
MITAGVDSGAQNVRIAIMKDGRVIGKALAPAGLNARDAAEEAYREALSGAGLTRKDVQRVFATGSGKRDCEFAHGNIAGLQACARGVNLVLPNARTVVELGAEAGSVFRINGSGDVTDLAVNEKCAAGAGVFLEAMARALETEVGKMADLYDRSKRRIAIYAHCAVFAESEVVSLVHAKTPKPDIVRAVLSAIAVRTASMVKRVGIEGQVAATGGVALNKGFVKALEEELDVRITVPECPDYISAIGAALAASDEKAEV